MDKGEEIPQKRFEQYEQVFDNQGIAIGFKVSGCDFLFKYDEQGNWKDEKGNLYNSKGILIKKQEEESDEESDEEDEGILDEFQKILEDEDKGIPRGKNKTNTKKKQEHENYSDSINKLLQNCKNKENLREDVPAQLFIFFKMKRKFYQKIKPQVEKAQSIAQANKEIDKIKKSIEAKTKEWKDKNKWIEENNTLFQYSGAQIGQSTYDRYWYGLIRASPENYNSIMESISSSEEFLLLENKTFYALKSKLYLKKKMSETIKELSKKIEEKADDDLIKIEINNLPQNFPCSFILDLCTFSGTPIQEIYSIDLFDEFNADLILSKKGATKFINVQGYCHDDKEFIELNVLEDQSKRKLVKSGFYKISVQTDKLLPYKVHSRQLSDTLALGKNREEMIKLFTEEEEKTNGGFRFVVGLSALKKVLMFRGNSLNVLKVQIFVS